MCGSFGVESYPSLIAAYSCYPCMLFRWVIWDFHPLKRGASKPKRRALQCIQMQKAKLDWILAIIYDWPGFAAAGTPDFRRHRIFGQAT